MNLKSYAAMLISIMLAAEVGSAQTSAQPDEITKKDALTKKDELTKKVDALFARWDKTDSPGCALGIIKDASLVYKRGYGMANLDYNIPLSSASVFYIASTSKQFTATSIALLVKQGKISLDDPIRKYVMELPALYDPVTIRHLVHHTSGIRDYLTLMPIAGIRTEDVYSDEDFIELLARQKNLNFKPGEQFLYSNSGYVLMAIIVKRATGKSLAQFAEENIFKPLGMNSTRFRDDRTIVVKNRATGYSHRLVGGFSTVVSNFDRVGDGGLLSSVEDLALWDRNLYENKLAGGGADLINQLLTVGTLNSGKKLTYAFGLMATEYKGLKMIGHGGSFFGYRTDMIRFPEQRFSVICLCNVDNVNPGSIVRQVADIYLSDHFKQDVAKGDAAKADAAPRAAEKVIELPSEELKDKVGAYRDTSTGTIWRLTAKDGELMASVFGLSFRLAALSAAHFRAVDAPVQVKIHFQKQNPGKPRTVNVELESQEPAALEAIELVSPTPTQLAEYAGDYYSDELQATYKLASEEGRLIVRRRNASVLHLNPTLKDQFEVSGTNVSFTRDDQGRVTGFSLSAGRVKDIRFVKEAVR